jgi:hypothetical protein
MSDVRRANFAAGIEDVDTEECNRCGVPWDALGIQTQEQSDAHHREHDAANRRRSAARSRRRAAGRLPELPLVHALDGGLR